MQKREQRLEQHKYPIGGSYLEFYSFILDRDIKRIRVLICYIGGTLSPNQSVGLVGHNQACWKQESLLYHSICWLATARAHISYGPSHWFNSRAPAHTKNTDPNYLSLNGRKSAATSLMLLKPTLYDQRLNLHLWDDITVHNRFFNLS